MIDHRIFQDIAKAPAMINIDTVQNVETVCRYIQILHEEGYPAMEILARPSLDSMLELLESLNDRPERKMIHLGIGTLKTEKTARHAVTLKPDFLVSPAFSRRVLNVAVDADIPYLPGVCTLQDVQDVLDAFEDVGREVTVLKLCPVEILTYSYVRMMGSIFAGITFCPTGTVTLATMPQWRKIPCIGPAMESSFIPCQMLENGQWESVRETLKDIRRLNSREIGSHTSSVRSHSTSPTRSL